MALPGRRWTRPWICCSARAEKVNASESLSLSHSSPRSEGRCAAPRRLEDADDLVAGEARFFAGNDGGAELMHSRQHLVIELGWSGAGFLERHESLDALPQRSNFVDEPFQIETAEGWIGIDHHLRHLFSGFHQEETDGNEGFY